MLLYVVAAALLLPLIYVLYFSDKVRERALCCSSRSRSLISCRPA